jgi:signal transduction histidine kinase
MEKIVLENRQTKSRSGLRTIFYKENLSAYLGVNQFEEQIQNKQLRVDIQTNANLPPVMGNEPHLRQVLSNLMSNAIKYTTPRGQITLAASYSHDEMVVSVRDTGVGIPLADQPHIFDKFYRVDHPEMADVKGTGLGLAITRSIVEKHGGRIWVESELNVGSTFSFALPIISAPLSDADKPR